MKPTTACFVAQYADWSGIDRYASADPTWTMTPESRSVIRRIAASVPWTYPR